MNVCRSDHTAHELPSALLSRTRQQTWHCVAAESIVQTSFDRIESA